MTVIQIRKAASPFAPACFGIACNQHGDCARYHAANGSEADPRTRGTCRTTEGRYPLFERIERVEAVAA